MRFEGFIGPSYTVRSKNVDCERLINLYPEINESGKGKEGEVLALYGTPGLSTLVTLAAAAEVRGLWKASNGRLYAVSGNKAYYVNSSWVATEIGTLNSSSGQVGMADNGLHLVIVDGTDGYVYTFAAESFAQITDEDFPGANHVAFQDGYFIFSRPNSGQFFISGINDVTFDALDFASSEGNPDEVVALLSNHRDLWVFNETTTEIFYNSGDQDFPFARIEGAFIEYGCVARYSIAKMNNAVFWLGGDNKGHGIVYMAQGYQPRRISTHAVEFAIRQYEDFSDAVAYTYQEEGHSFYVLNFPSANSTWVYDSSTGMWHERAYHSSGIYSRHRSNCHTFAYGKHVVGDYENGKLYEMSSSVYDDAGQPKRWQRTLPHISAGGKNVFYSMLQVDAETGVGLDGTQQGTNPQMMLKFSDDGGHTWSNEKWASIGQIGQRTKRAIWRRLGRSRDRVFQVSGSDPVKWVLIGANLELEAGVA